MTMDAHGNMSAEQHGLLRVTTVCLMSSSVLLGVITMSVEQHSLLIETRIPPAVLVSADASGVNGDSLTV